MLTRQMVQDLVVEELHRRDSTVWHIALTQMIHPHAVEGAVQQLLRDGQIERLATDPSFYRLKRSRVQDLIPPWWRWMCQPR